MSNQNLNNMKKKLLLLILAFTQLHLSAQEPTKPEAREKAKPMS
jgi:hypothetical protein